MRKPGTRNTIVPRDAGVVNDMVTGQPDVQDPFKLTYVPQSTTVTAGNEGAGLNMASHLLLQRSSSCPSGQWQIFCVCV
jgi:hypothetical protein